MVIISFPLLVNILELKFMTLVKSNHIIQNEHYSVVTVSISSVGEEAGDALGNFFFYFRAFTVCLFMLFHEDRNMMICTSSISFKY